MKLTVENVSKVFKACMYETAPASVEDIPHGSIIAEGIFDNHVFDPKRVEKQRDNIKDLIGQLSNQAVEGEAVVVSFMDLPITSNGRQWGEQVNAEQLMVIGIAAEYIKYVLPSDQWSNLPGGMPMLILSLKEKAEAKDD